MGIKNATDRGKASEGKTRLVGSCAPVGKERAPLQSRPHFASMASRGWGARPGLDAPALGSAVPRCC